MTDLETMQRAKMYLDKLANGINPLTDQPASDSDYTGLPVKTTSEKVFVNIGVLC